MGEIYLESQLYEKAIEQFKKLLLIDESYPDANYNIALVFEKINDLLSFYRYARTELSIPDKSLGVAKQPIKSQWFYQKYEFCRNEKIKRLEKIKQD